VGYVSAKVGSKFPRNNFPSYHHRRYNWGAFGTPIISTPLKSFSLIELPFIFLRTLKVQVENMSTSSTAYDNADLILGFEKLFPSLHSLLSIHNTAKHDGTSLVYTDEELGSALDIGRKAEAELHSMRELIQKLTQQSASCEEALKFHSSATAPIRRIPTEILERILLATLGIPNNGESALSLDTHFEYGNVIQTDAGVWILRQVCRRWKILVDSSPRMWTCLHLEFGPFDSKLPSLGIVQAYLKRSSTLPLDVSFHVDSESGLPSSVRYGNGWTISGQSYKDAFLAFCAQSFRWRTAKIRIHESHVDILSQVTNLDNLVLLRLDVIPFYASEEEGGPNLPASWTTLPSIQFLDLQESRLIPNEGSFANIRQLALRPRVRDVSFHQFSLLTSLTFTSGADPLSLRGPVEHLALRALDITQTRLRRASELRLVLKSLNSLATSIYDPSDVISLSKVLSFFQCQNLSKLVVRLMGKKVTARDRGELSKLFASCHSLEIVCMSIYAGSVSPFSREESSAVISRAFAIWKLFNRQQYSYLPKLKHLEVCLEFRRTVLDPLKFMPAPAAELIDMMESRANISTSNLISATPSPTEDGCLLPLECVTWRSAMSLSFSDTDQEHLNLLRQRGLRYESFIMNPHEPWRLEGFYI
jgi:hypothetical protein